MSHPLGILAFTTSRRVRLDATVRFDHKLLAVEEEHAVNCMLELALPPAPDSGERAPLHLALVVDRSGSMSGRKLEVAKECATFLARRLKTTDQLALVAYDDEVTLVRPLAPADEHDTTARIAGILPGGTTNLSGGWLKGLEELGRAKRSPKNTVRRVLLLTDGLANVGITDRGELSRLAGGTKQTAATTTIGFGDGFDEDLLTQIADASGGATYYAEDPDAAPGIFAEEFDGLTTLVVQNVSVEIRPDPAVDLLGVLNEYPSVRVPGGVQVQVGDGYGGETRRLVFQLHVPHVAQLGPKKIADIVLRYVTVDDQVAAHETTIPVVVNLVSADDPGAADIDTDVVDEVVLLRAARAKKEAMRLADEGDYGGARDALHQASSDIRGISASSARSAELMQELSLLDDHTGAISAGAYDSSRRKRMNLESWRSSRGRRPGR
jgi:Ca-activated chloride channel family protein